MAEDKVDLVSLRSADLHLRFKVIKEGFVVYEAKPGLRARLESSTLIEYLDARGMYEVYLRRLLKQRRS